jgi:hypothetical protein
MKKILVILGCIVALFSVTQFTPVAVYADQSTGCVTGGVLGFKPWYDRVAYGQNCEVKVGTNSGDLEGFIWKIALTVMEDLLTAIAYVAVGFVIYAAFKYMTAQGDVGQLEKAKKTLQNAIIGLVIAIFAAVAVNVLFSVLKI